MCICCDICLLVFAFVFPFSFIFMYKISIIAWCFLASESGLNVFYRINVNGLEQYCDELPNYVDKLCFLCDSCCWILTSLCWTFYLVTVYSIHCGLCGNPWVHLMMCLYVGDGESWWYIQDIGANEIFIVIYCVKCLRFLIGIFFCRIWDVYWNFLCRMFEMFIGIYCVKCLTLYSKMCI